MTARAVGWTPAAVRDLGRLDPPEARGVVAAVDRNAEAGVGDVRRLRDMDPPELRLRVGGWRVRFRQDAATVTVLSVRRRDKAYR